MLVLSRKTGEEILIDRDIRIAVLATSGSVVRLGIIAPKSVRVLRQELCEPPKIHEATAAQTVNTDNDASASSKLEWELARVGDVIALTANNVSAPSDSTITARLARIAR